MKKLTLVVLLLAMLLSVWTGTALAAEPEAEDSPAWIAALGEEQEAQQLFVVGGVGETTAWVSLHEKDESGAWKQLMTTPGYIGKHGLGKQAEGDGMTPVGTFSFNAAFGIAEDPGCALAYHQVTDEDYWSGDQREGYGYNEMVSLRDLPDLNTGDSEHIVDYSREYQYCLNISYNEAGTPGLGSAIFLHCLGALKPYTGGCVAIPQEKMLTVMQQVRPDCVVVIDSLRTLSPETWESLGLEPAGDWTREGYYMDESENMLSVTWMDDISEPGWYVGVMLGEDLIEDSWGGTLSQKGNSLHGVLISSGSKADLSVTVSEEGEDGLQLAVEGGETYHFTAFEMPQASIMVSLNIEGLGMIDYEAGETAPVLDPEWPYQSAQINLAGPETYTFAAAPQGGHLFVKWTKNGEDFSTEPVITVLLDESADYVAVFEEDASWQNPVMNVVGEYQCDRAHATVMCFGFDEAWIIIEQGDSASEVTQWNLCGRLDTDTLSIAYTDGLKALLTYDENGELESQESLYEDGTGTVSFHEDGSFTWHEDQSESGEDLTFEWLPVEGD